MSLGSAAPLSFRKILQSRTTHFICSRLREVVFVLKNTVAGHTSKQTVQGHHNSGSYFQKQKLILSQMENKIG